MHIDLILCKKALFIPYLVHLSGCVTMEWRGGMVPHIGADETVKAKNQTIINNSTSLRECTSKWNQYRGPNRDGHIPVQGVPVNWKKVPNTLWKVSAGAGHSSVLIESKTVFTLEQNKDKETLFARHLSNGQEKWQYSQETKWSVMMSGPGPRSTPTLLGGKVYSLFSNGMLCRIDAETRIPEWKVKTVDQEF